MYPTVADVLALPVVRHGRPRVVAGADGLDTRVRWVHVAEVADIGHLLKGGELVLTTGIALPDDPAALAKYVDGLAEAGVAGLVVELVRHWSDALPPALVAAADRDGLPLITLSRETRYVTVTETVNGLIVDAQVAELRAAEQVHQVFTELTVSGADPADVLREVVRMTERPAVLETLSHEVLAYDAAGADPGELLGGWLSRSRSVHVGERTAYAAEAGWLITIVGARGHDWGRLIVVSDEQPPHRHVVVVERAASALAVHRLVARDSDSLERQAHRAVLGELLASPLPSAELLARASALGVPLPGRQLVGVAIRPLLTAAKQPSVSASAVLRELAETVSLAARRAKVSALVAVVDELSVRALLSLSPQANVDAVLERLAGEIRQPRVVAAGTTVSSPAHAQRSLIEAAQVAAAALHAGSGRAVHRLEDVRLRGLLHLLADDERVRAFAARELGPLLSRDAASGTRLLQALRHYCEQGGNKSAAAAAAHTSRTAYYQQLARIEQVLGVPLEDPESMLSLYVALLAHDLGE
ncbi:PucR family transcriptional regulator ligand-binding domain-containing protein [Amycolatopsis acidiphila]|uniref:PucR family transcriptional regulator n=1 Tax=Amycolatopsis acidiphila TaxID=715473 RepID=A0A558A5Y0_9PSEU|nr:PucR family transcriptional regulator [Amycolatopsis acidiphila]TVT19656.1 PucR family transcriptional regulator [Amycolatopsis acidiphila]UIJ61826.1 PucR family transcriptional regulator ligand-binding domain-containing protein [Amycolatopsis acidiphila]GHG57719.1 CdaR family transcriptional regulator [Amycolatopsis acidiphila]